MDEIDEHIIELLRKDARMTYTQIARHLKLSEGTIRRRIQSLIESKIIRRFTVETWNNAPKALVLISIAPSTPTPHIAELISKIKGVDLLFEVAGPYDIMLTISSKDISSINHGIEKIRSIPGVQQTNTFFVLQEW